MAPSPYAKTLARRGRELAGAWLRGVPVIGKELYHFWQRFCEWMPVSRRHAHLSKHAKVGVQDAASRQLVELFQQCDSDFHGGQMLGTALAT
jgi:hypothetical protein